MIICGNDFEFSVHILLLLNYSDPSIMNWCVDVSRSCLDTWTDLSIMNEIPRSWTDPIYFHQISSTSSTEPLDHERYPLDLMNKEQFDHDSVSPLIMTPWIPAIHERIPRSL